MGEPIVMDIPHQLGRAGARERLEGGVGQIAKAVPGGTLVSHHWSGDTLTFVIEALGQRIGAQLEVLETHVHAIFDLPPLLSLFANSLRSEMLGIGTKLLR
jgi:hypothetical protein